MLIQPADGSPGIFVDRLTVEAVVPSLSVIRQGVPDHYFVALKCGAAVEISRSDAERLLAEIAGK